MPTWVPIAVSTLLALAPALIWGKLLLDRTGQERRSLFWIFVGGSLTVVPIFLLQMLWTKYPILNVIEHIESSSLTTVYSTLIVFGIFGALEEIVKQGVVRVVDRRHPELLKTINATLVFSITAGLGFSFAENIFYFYNIWVTYGATDLISAFVFRSIFTAAGHMIFSGIWGYYYGIAKFASDITAVQRYTGKKFIMTRILTKIFGMNLKTYEVYRQQKIIQGLLLAMGIHAIFNFLLQMNYVLPVIGLIAITGTFVYYLMHRIAGNLAFSFAINKPSTIAVRDEQVVIEMLGMFTQQGKFREVMDICDKLLERDPNNNVVRLFRAKAADNTKLKTMYQSLKNVFQKSQAPSITRSEKPELAVKQEQTVAELLDMWYENANYKQVVDVAQKMLARNPESKGAQIILQKAMDKQKMEKVYNSLSRLFEGTESPQNKV
jgi:RsiW-degrading membrane proteinase PrsW (M82 family)